MSTTARRGIAGGITGCAAAAWLAVIGVVLMAAPAADAGSRRDVPGTIIARAERGDPRAETMLGYMYFTGDGVAQSHVAAVDWYTRAAHQGDPDAQYLLGLMYDKGLGVDSDVIKAYKWLNLAASHAPRGNRGNYVRIRDAVASKMTPDQLVVGQKLAVEFIPTRP
jgi:TPR repeat protein